MKVRSLTSQQTKILKLICRELSPTQISERLNISEKTFFNHRNELKRRTKAKTNIGLYKYAVKHKLI